MSQPHNHEPHHHFRRLVAVRKVGESGLVQSIEAQPDERRCPPLPRPSLLVDQTVGKLVTHVVQEQVGVDRRIDIRKRRDGNSPGPIPGPGGAPLQISPVSSAGPSI